MRFATLSFHGRTAAALNFGSHYRLTPFGDVAALLREVDGDLTRAADLKVEDTVPCEEAILAPTVLTPTKIICLGLNYADHIEEMGHGKEQYPTLFAKFPATLTGPFDDIEIPSLSNAVDWEVELGVIIGTTARKVATENSRDHIAGFVVANDVSMRDFQRRTSQFLQGKIFERTTPIGPEMVTPDEVDYALDLRISCSVDGVEMQSSRTSNMITTVEESISYISQIVTLEPGDLILTGTPSGVGAGRTPAVFLKNDQVVTSYVEGVGELINRFVS